MLEKWKCAVIHLECATDSEDYRLQSKTLGDQLQNGSFDAAQFEENNKHHSRDVRFHGTALFISHLGRRYLLTARHVIWDELSAKITIEEEVQDLNKIDDGEFKKLRHESAIEKYKNNVFGIIFRVPSFNEVQDGRENNIEFLMNLGAGVSYSLPYTFSSPEIDLAIISLDQRDSQFANSLIASGYIPVDLEEIESGPQHEGQDVFTIGFPSATSLLGQVMQHPALGGWSSSNFSLPVSSFGKVSMLHESLPFFWADMSIYPGNSGGPVIAHDKLIGIVSAQAVLPFDDMPNLRSRIPFAKIIRAQFIKDILNKQIAKDNYRT